MGITLDSSLYWTLHTDQYFVQNLVVNIAQVVIKRLKADCM